MTRSPARGRGLQATFPAAMYSIGTVARLTGISTHALRAWEHRYGLEASGRTAGGSRRYTEADIERLRWIRDLAAYGHTIGDLVRLPHRDLERLFDERLATNSTGHGPRAEVVDRAALRDDFLRSIAAMDLQTAERVLARALVLLDAGSVVMDVVIPLLEEVGRAWEKGRMSIAHEHAASAIIRSQLGALVRAEPAGSDDLPVAVSATLAGELHEFGALCAAAIANTRRWRALYLGPSLPALEIAGAARTARARTVLVSAISLSCSRVIDELRLLRSRLGKNVVIIAGGHATEEAAPLPDRVFGPMSLTGLATQLEALDVRDR